MPGPVPAHSCDQTLYLQPTASIKGRPLSPAAASASLFRRPHSQVTSSSFPSQLLLFKNKVLQEYKEDFFLFI